MRTTNKNTDMQAFNYIIYAPAARQLKFGVTCNAKRRIAEHMRLLRKVGMESGAAIAVFPELKGIARMTEQCLRERYAVIALPGHMEWLKADRATFLSVCDMTKAYQSQLNMILLEGVVHA